MASKGPEHVQLQQVQATDRIHVEKVQASSQAIGAHRPIHGELTGQFTQALEGVESHWNKLESVLKTSLSKPLDMQDCIKLQIMAQKYSMELDLTGKVVEKAMNGLKDTLKTQV